MPGLVVVNGAIIQCNKCVGATAVLSVTTNFLLNPEVGGQPVATINDHQVGINVSAFPGDCQTTHQPCEPQTPSPWVPGESMALVSSMAPVIAQTATLLCATGGGTISIGYPGQMDYQVNLPPGVETIIENGVLLGYVMSDKGITRIFNVAGKQIAINEQGASNEWEDLLWVIPGGSVLRGVKALRRIWVTSKATDIAVRRVIPAAILARLRAAAAPGSVRRHIPPGWKPTLTKRGRGAIWKNPTHPNNSVRYSPGNRKNPHPDSRRPHVVAKDKAGNTLRPDGSKTPETVIGNKKFPEGNNRHPDGHQRPEDFRGHVGE